MGQKGEGTENRDKLASGLTLSMQTTSIEHDILSSESILKDLSSGVWHAKIQRTDEELQLLEVEKRTWRGPFWAPNKGETTGMVKRGWELDLSSSVETKAFGTWVLNQFLSFLDDIFVY